MLKSALHFIALFSMAAASCGTADDTLGTTTGEVLTYDERASKPDRAGSRLQVIYQRWSADDGARVTIPQNRFLDRKLGVRCTLDLAEDGVQRCLPETDARPSTDIFLDAACTQPVVSTMKCSPTPAYAYEFRTGAAACPVAGKTFYKLGAAYTPTTLYGKFQPPDFGPCAALPADRLAKLVSDQNFYPYTPVAITEFVKGQQESVVVR